MKKISMCFIMLVIIGHSWIVSAKLISGENANSALTARLQPLTSASLEDAQFGWATAISGEFAAISAPMELIDDQESGTVYIYRNGPSGWNEFQKIIPQDPQFFQHFGHALCLEDDKLLIGSPGFNGNTGLVYTFTFDGNKWVESQQMAPPVPVPFSEFGSRIDLKGDLAAVSSVTTVKRGKASGIVYLFRFDGTAWQEVDRIVSPGTNENDIFGAGINLVNENSIVVSAPRGHGPVEECGLVYSLRKSDDEWKVQQIIEPEFARTNGLFGADLDYADDRLVIGAMETLVDSVYCGDAYIYKMDDDGLWEKEKRLLPESANDHDHFGARVVMGERFVLIGSPKRDLDVKDEDHGCTFIFTYNDTTWQQTGIIAPETLGKGDHFGLSMAVDGDELVIGSSLDDNTESNSGSVYFYDLKKITGTFMKNSIPIAFELFKNYPNPFNPETTIKYNLPSQTNVNISIYDILGRKIVELVNEQQTAGRKQITWNGKDSNHKPVSSGTYIYRFESKKYSASRKMLLLK